MEFKFTPYGATPAWQRLLDPDPDYLKNFQFEQNPNTPSVAPQMGIGEGGSVLGESPNFMQMNLQDSGAGMAGSGAGMMGIGKAISGLSAQQQNRPLAPLPQVHLGQIQPHEMKFVSPYAALAELQAGRLRR